MPELCHHRIFASSRLHPNTGSDAGCREKLSEFCDSLIAPPRQQKEPNENEGVAGDSTNELTMEERKKRAKEMQTRLMADMAKKQQVKGFRYQRKLWMLCAWREIIQTGYALADRKKT